MEQSILKSTKKILGVGDDDTSFDLDIITHINSAFSNLADLGVGPVAGCAIEDDTTVWTDILDVDRIQLSRIKTYVFLRVRLAFDPPTSSYLLGSLQKQIEECEWRLNVNREATDWVDPDPDPDAPIPAPVTPPPVVVDGGDAG